MRRGRGGRAAKLVNMDSFRARVAAHEASGGRW